MNTRPISPEHFADVLRLNDESVAFLSPLSSPALAKLLAQSSFHRVVDAGERMREQMGERMGEQIIGFVLALRQGADYESENYRWFDSRYPDFLYVDRVVISKTAQLSGIGSILYREVFEHARAHRIPVVACEFDIEPPNPASARFHQKFGFAEVGQQRVQGGKKWVSLQMAPVGPGMAGA